MERHLCQTPDRALFHRAPRRGRNHRHWRRRGGDDAVVRAGGEDRQREFGGGLKCGLNRQLSWWFSIWRGPPPPEGGGASQSFLRTLSRIGLGDPPEAPQRRRE